MFSSLSRRRVMVLVVLTCLLFITLDRRGNPVIDRARGVFAVVLRPLDSAISAIALPIERTWYGITNYDDLERENEALRDRIEHMKGNDVEAQSAVLEYRELLKVNQLTSKFIYDVVTAQVVGESPSNFQNTVEISVGSLQGVAVGMPVTDGAGLIGRITQVFPSRSIVLLISDPEYSIGAQVLSTTEQVEAETPPSSTTPSGIPVVDLTSTTSSTTTSTTNPDDTNEPGQTTTSNSSGPANNTTTTVLEVIRETGTLEGQGGNKPMLLRFTDSTSSVTSVKVGAIVDTAGGNDSLAPQGIPIGIITRIVEQSGSSSALVEVTPNASLRRLNFVAVVFYVPNKDAVGR